VLTLKVAERHDEKHENLLLALAKLTETASRVLSFPLFLLCFEGLTAFCCVTCICRHDILVEMALLLIQPC
jgi:hypothetical protein